jgi:hypothetical protein
MKEAGSMADETENPVKNGTARKAVSAAEPPVPEAVETVVVEAIEVPAPAEEVTVEVAPIAPAPAPKAVKVTEKAAEPAVVVPAPTVKMAKAAKPVVVRKPKRVAPPKTKITLPKTHVTKTQIAKIRNTRTKSEVSPARPQLKDTIMAKTSPLDFTAQFQTAFSDFQEKAKSAYEKSTVAFGEANEFAKGNVEALVESSKILASGLQELGSALVTDGRSSFETLSSEVKELAATKSPTEFLQLQSTLMRRHFDSAVAFGSKNSEAMLKLANDAFSPISTRVSLAVQKASVAA